MTSIFSRNQSKIIHAINQMGKTATLVLFCFCYEKCRPKHGYKVSLCLQNSWKQPQLKIALWCIASSVLNKCTSCMPIDCVSVDTHTHTHTQTQTNKQNSWSLQNMDHFKTWVTPELDLKALPAAVKIFFQIKNIQCPANCKQSSGNYCYSLISSQKGAWCLINRKKKKLTKP